MVAGDSTPTYHPSMDAAKVTSFHIEEKRTFNAPKAAIYAALHDVRRWPERLPHVLAIDIRYDDGTYQEFDMTVASQPENIRVRSIRNCRPDVIEWFQPEPPIFLRHHAGEWRFFEAGGGRCEVVVSHAWNLEPDNAARVFPPNGECSTEQQVAAMLAEHSRQTLDSWQAVLQGDDTVNITETVTVKTPVAKVYEAFADLRRWKEILPDVVEVDVLYFDGYHQEFTMTVERHGGTETVRGIRYCRPHAELEMVQTTPPPGLSRMCGKWAFHEVDGTTTVTATRAFRLAANEAGSADQHQFGEQLAATLRTNLSLFKDALEST